MAKRQKNDAGQLEGQTTERANITMKPRGRGARTAGKLAPLLNMPMEILVEVASHLHPLDVLQLSRASRFFNDLLMSKHSRPVWRASVSSLGVPECPSDMSEPAYVALLFDNMVCMGCSKRTRCDPSLTLRVRVCKRCPAKIVRRGSEILKNLLVNRPQEGLTNDPQAHHYELLSMVPYQEPTLTFGDNTIEATRCRKLSSQWFHVPTFNKIASRYFELIEKGPQEELNEFVKQERERTKEVHQHAQKVHEWLEQCAKQKSETDLVLATEFHDAVCAELLKIGYTQEDFSRLDSASSTYWSIESLEWRDYTRQAKVFSPRLWASVRPKLISIIDRNREHTDRMRVATRRKKFQDLLKTKINTLSQREATGDDDRDTARGLYVPIAAVSELKFPIINEFEEESAKLAATDEWQEFPDDVWNKLVENGIMDRIDERRQNAIIILNEQLIYAINPPPARNSTRPSLQPGGAKDIVAWLTVHHAAAFFKYHDYCILDRIHDRLGRREIAQGKLFVYKEVVKYLGRCVGAYDELLKPRGIDAHGMGQNVCKWEGEQIAIQLATALLEDLGYGSRCSDSTGRNDVDTILSDEEENAGLNIQTFVSMTGMEAKGSVFVCMRCPEEGRARRNWKDLVTHFYEAAISFQNAMPAYHHPCVGEARDSVAPPINIHAPTAKEAISSDNVLLAIEDASFANGPCPVDISHEHEGGPIGLYMCSICCMLGVNTTAAWNWRVCAETHVKSRHGRPTADGDIVVVLL